MRASALVLVLSAALVAGCGGSHGSSGSANGEASKSPARVLADAKAAVASSSSVHVTGNVSSGGAPSSSIALDLSIATGKGATGSMTTGGLEFDLVAIGNTAYIRGSDAFYKKFAGAQVAQLLHGKWLKASTKTGRFASLAALTNINVLFGKIASSHGKLTNDGATTYNGQKVVELRDITKGGKLYVAATGKPYPVALVGGKKGQSGTIAFGDWNTSVSLSPPKSALDISKLGG